MPVNGSSIRDILIRKTYDNYSDILLNWLIFGPSGHERRPDGLVIENFTWRFPDDAEANRHVKSLVRTEDLVAIGSTPHIFDCARPTCNARGETVMSYAMQPTACHDVMVINHYFSKSVEEWEFKRRRGRGDSLEPHGDRIFSDVRMCDTGGTRALRLRQEVSLRSAVHETSVAFYQARAFAISSRNCTSSASSRHGMR
jgi:hypothetical protein